jgi:hypothetical protein
MVGCGACKESGRSTAEIVSAGVIIRLIRRGDTSQIQLNLRQNPLDYSNTLSGISELILLNTMILEKSNISWAA